MAECTLTRKRCFVSTRFGLTHIQSRLYIRNTMTKLYTVAANRSINPDQERMMAKRANTKTVEVNPSHVAYMSHPKETAKLIEEAATSARINVAA